MSDYLSTGQAAQICSVTPDTVLKWIRGGKLSARRTVGGHYRVAREDLAVLLGEAPRGPREGLLVVSHGSGVAGGSTPPGVAENSTLGPDYPRNGTLGPDYPRPGFRECWEYHIRDGEVEEGCQQCLAFRARTMRCFELSALSVETGYGGVFCGTSPEACAYLQDPARRPANVLVITDDVGFRQALEQDHDGARFHLQFTHCEYECSLLVDSFRPDYVVVDCSLPREQCEEFCRHVAQDPRIRGVKIILAAPPAAERGIMRMDPHGG